ncbi:MAG: CPBP family intramembrane glutamic endopeptidase [Thermoguttaceae bacterium]
MTLPEAVFLVLAALAAVAAWAAVARRWLGRRPLMAYQPRRPVPWRGIDVAVLVATYGLMPFLVMHVAQDWFGMEPPVEARAQRANTEHPVGRVLLERPGVSAVLVSVALAAIVAPLVEELLFRLLLQGWFESLERRSRRGARLCRPFMAGVVPVTLVALLFAGIHFREPEPVSMPTIVYFQNVQLVASLLTVGVLIGWLRFAVGATFEDLGIVRSKLMADIKLGLVALAATLAPIYGVATVAKALLPAGVVADPIPLFPLALVLGILYYRTHRIVPAIVMHMGFNAAAVLLALSTTPS